jgi:hypothetical protein
MIFPCEISFQSQAPQHNDGPKDDLEGMFMA